MTRLVLCLLLGILFQIYRVKCACEPYLHQPPLCASRIDVAIIEPPPPGNQSFYAQNIQQLISALNTIDPRVCGATATAFACANYFRACPSNASDPVQSGVRVCKATCLNFLSDCAQIFSQFGTAIPPEAIPNCSAKDATGQDEFPDGSYNITGSDGEVYTRECNNGVNNATTDDCVAPLAFLSAEPLVKCQRACPQRFDSLRQIKGMKIMMIVLTFPTVVCNLGMICLLLLTPSRRRWPGIMTLFMFVTNELAVLSFVVSLGARFEDHWCYNSNFARQDRHITAPCVVSGIFFLFGMLSFLLWWAFQAIQMALIVINMKFELLWQVILANAISWGLPLVAVIIAAATRNFGYQGDAPLCFLRVDGNADYIFWYPVIVITFTVIPLLFFVVVRLCMLGGISALKAQWRLLLMIVYSAATYSLFSATFLENKTNKTEYKNSLAEYYICITSGSPDCELRQRPSYAIKIGFFALMAFTGTVYALICGLDRDFISTMKRFRAAPSLWAFLQQSWSGSVSSLANSPRKGENSSREMELEDSKTDF